MASGTASCGDEDISSEMEQRGIPKATFIEGVDTFLKENKFTNIQEAAQSFEQMYRRYKQIEQAFAQRRLRLLSQFPDIQKTLEVVRQLKVKNTDLDVNFEVANQLYAKAHIAKADTVGLWLGANVMLDYSLDEAEKVILENEESAKKSAMNTEKTLEFIKDQCTTIEVNLARLHNLSVKLRQNAGGNVQVNA